MKHRPQAIEPETVAEHLLDAGIAEVSAAAELLAGTPSERETVRGLTEAARGIELTVKALVAQLQWTQIFSNPSEASLGALSSGEFKSATIDECLKRITQLTGVAIDDRHEKRLRALRKRRNVYEHLGRIDSVDALRGAIGAALQALIELLTEAEKSPRFPDGLADVRTKLAQRLVEFDRFAKARMADIAPALKEQEAFECPRCEQEAAVLDDGLYCHFCVMRTSAEEAARHYIETTSDYSPPGPGEYGEDWPIFTCPSCEADALVQRTDGSFFCFACSDEWDPSQLERCCECNRMIPVSDETGICSECLGEKMRRDD